MRHTEKVYPRRAINTLILLLKANRYGFVKLRRQLEGFGDRLVHRLFDGGLLAHGFVKDIHLHLVDFAAGLGVEIPIVGNKLGLLRPDIDEVIA